MKKFLCVFLSLLLTLSVVTVAFAADEGEKKSLAEVLAENNIDQSFIDAFTGKTLDLTQFKGDSRFYSNGKYNVTNIINAGKDGIGKVEFLGLNLGQLYKETPVLDWGQLSVSKTQVTNLYGQLNAYLMGTLKKRYMQDDTLCTADNATAIANCVGSLLNANFTKVKISYSTSYVLRNDFFRDISDKSGLTDAIINGWLTTKTVKDVTTYEPKANINYRALLVGALGVPLLKSDGTGGSMAMFNEYFTTDPTKEYTVPRDLGGWILKSVVENAINKGPIQYLIDVLYRFATGYTIDLYKPVVALLNNKINSGVVSESDLISFDVLLNTLFNDKNENNTSRLQCVPFPVSDFARPDASGNGSYDVAEKFLYLMIYTNLLGKHQNNEAVVNQLKSTVGKNPSLTTEEKEDIKVIIDGMFLGDLTKLANSMREISKKVIDNTSSVWGWNFYNFFARFWKTIADFFDGIFRSFRNGINLDQFLD